MAGHRLKAWPLSALTLSAVFELSILVQGLSKLGLCLLASRLSLQAFRIVGLWCVDPGLERRTRSPDRHVLCVALDRVANAYGVGSAGYVGAAAKAVLQSTRADAHVELKRTRVAYRC